MGDAEGEISVLNMDFIARISRRMSSFVEAGVLRPMAVDIFFCLLLCPCQEYSRLFLSKAAVTPLEKAIAEIGDSVWRNMASGEHSGNDTELQMRSNRQKRRKS